MPDPSSKVATETVWLWVHRLLAPLMTVILGVLGFILVNVWTYVREMDARVTVIELWRAETSGNRFSSGDWVTAKAKIDEDRALLDRRVTRMEEAIPQIRESLVRIESGLESLRDDQRN